MTEPVSLYPDAPPWPDEFRRACELCLDAFARLPDATPERWWQLLALLIANVVYKINWTCPEQRDAAMAELLAKLRRDFALFDQPDCGAVGHA